MSFFLWLCMFIKISSASDVQNLNYVVNSDFNYLPYMGINSNSGEPIGFEWELLGLVLKAKNLKNEIDFQSSPNDSNRKRFTLKKGRHYSSFDDLMKDLSASSVDKSAAIVAAIDYRDNTGWLPTPPAEFTANHYLFGYAKNIEKGSVSWEEDGKIIKVQNLIVDSEPNRGLKIGVERGSVLDHQLSAIYKGARYITILRFDLAQSGQPLEWLNRGVVDVVYTFASGPKNDITGAGYVTHGVVESKSTLGTSFKTGTVPYFSKDAVGREMADVWKTGFVHMLADPKLRNEFFELHYRYFGRVAMRLEEQYLKDNLDPYIFNNLQNFIKAFEESKTISPNFHQM